MTESELDKQIAAKWINKPIARMTEPEAAWNAMLLTYKQYRFADFVDEQNIFLHLINDIAEIYGLEADND